MDAFIPQILAVAILLLFPVWRIFKRAGLRPALSLTVLIPYVGLLVSGVILAISRWSLRPATKGDE